VPRQQWISCARWARAADARALAYRLFKIATRKGWATEALVYNELAQEWVRLEDLAQDIGTPAGLAGDAQGKLIVGTRMTADKERCRLQDGLFHLGKGLAPFVTARLWTSFYCYRQE
jgi:hypothetical protein